ncbi:MAG: hypothetical protein ACLSAF_13475 [Intestinimonas sp.]
MEHRLGPQRPRPRRTGGAACAGGVFGGDLGLFSPYLHGMCRKDGLTMAVTSGLGSQRERLPRFHNPPEIMVIDLTPES